MTVTMKYIAMAKIGSPHGVKGHFKLFSYTEPHENILQYSPLAVYRTRDIPQEGLEISEKLPQIKLELVSKKPSKYLIVQNPDVLDRNHAESLTNAYILTPAENLKDLSANEYYWHQLIGLRVINEEGYEIGAVKQLSTAGKNELLEIQKNKPRTTTYIPWVMDHYILNVDLTENVITVHWPEDY